MCNWTSFCRTVYFMSIYVWMCKLKLSNCVWYISIYVCAVEPNSVELCIWCQSNLIESLSKRRYRTMCHWTPWCRTMCCRPRCYSPVFVAELVARDSHRSFLRLCETLQIGEVRVINFTRLWSKRETAWDGFDCLKIGTSSTQRPFEASFVRMG
jgi:hypothetical protein